MKTLTLKNRLTLLVYFIGILSMNAQTSQIPNESTPFTLGEIRHIDSKILSEKRVINIYLPEGYDKKDSVSYPVMYVLDGSANEDFIHIVGLVQFFNMQFMPKTIVIGIANIDRKRDFTYATEIKKLKEKYPTTGGSAKFIDFIEKELQPFVEENYKTRSQKFIIGQSLGGLLATEILLKKPDLFTNYMIVSPSIWWDDESLLKEAPELLAKQKDIPLRVYISVGAEGKMMEGGALHITEILKKSGKKHLQVDFISLPKENHATILHQSINDALKLLYPYKD